LVPKSMKRVLSAPTRESDQNKEKENSKPPLSELRKESIYTMGILRKSKKRRRSKEKKKKMSHKLSMNAGKPSELFNHKLTNRIHLNILKAEVNFDPNPYVNYQLEVNDQEGKLKWMLCKRFKQFQTLHVRLQKLGISVEAALPPKKMFGNMKKRFIERRRKDLNTYLETLTWSKTVLESDEFRDFLIPPEWSKKFEERQQRREAHKKKQKLPKRKRMSINMRAEKVRRKHRASVVTPLVQRNLGVYWEDHRNIAPSLYNLIDAVLDLEPQSLIGFGVSKTALFLARNCLEGVFSRLVVTKLSQLTNEETAVKGVDWIIGILWPDGPRGDFFSSDPNAWPGREDGAKLQLEARQCLSQLCKDFVPGSVSRLLGERYLEGCSSRFLRFLQLNLILKHFIYTVIDSAFEELFPKERIYKKPVKKKHTIADLKQLSD